ncbi:hypothetical protein HaLaN_07197 [Haematococcus lacustris]|uniref:Uncharacterized protein n=1 Tax=Haematococcus lacustris TaxID=44745 RepID=A0A699Z804_HAELA|nr:hypothetical protein HaLaN_07197 [Haematococcus lacustris]
MSSVIWGCTPPWGMGPHSSHLTDFTDVKSALCPTWGMLRLMGPGGADHHCASAHGHFIPPGSAAALGAGKTRLLQAQPLTVPQLQPQLVWASALVQQLLQAEQLTVPQHLPAASACVRLNPGSAPDSSRQWGLAADCASASASAATAASSASAKPAAEPHRLLLSPPTS